MGPILWGQLARFCNPIPHPFLFSVFECICVFDLYFVVFVFSLDCSSCSLGGMVVLPVTVIRAPNPLQFSALSPFSLLSHSPVKT